MERIAIKTDFIKLEALLKFSALTSSGGEAKTVIGEGLVGVNGETCLQRGRKIYPGDIVSFCGAELMVEKEENKQK
ncbi:MAG: RNA-binding S4 domain-containing protein [Oscillospiraceae bacterium]|nr:RNA-binding S4 domain-containing protein [Oscillospiraceae bacterium]MBO7373472.1 RNA-binding S4 domain-containing protein [Oscillospiraceae bacterium]MBP5239070.1 RNA-binding S4 domain-containing protein [Oscillospiraceae bacterium]MBP5743511.1 RNA-binding S4 domain-containing protein [Oscillospiraceae bacterium]